MDAETFWDAIDQHPDLILKHVCEGETPADDYVVIVEVSTGRRVALAIESIARTPRVDILIDIIRGRRNPQILKHISRVVGYYALHHNMNRSKLAEIRDRHRGDYAVPETTRSAA